MPVFAADLLPDTTGRNLGNPYQLWNGNFQSLNVQGGISMQPVAGAVITPSGAIYVLTVPVTANANTTGFQNLAGCTVQAGLLNAPGKVLRCVMGGTYTTQAGQTPGFGISGFFLGVSVFQAAAPPLLAAQAHNTWRAELTISVSSPGATGTIESSGTMYYEPTYGGVCNALVNPLFASIGPVDLTNPTNLSIACNFSTNTSPANVCVQRQMIVEVLN